MAEQSVSQLFNDMVPMFVKKFGPQWKRKTALATVTPPASSGGSTAALSTHEALDWIEGHPAKDPSTNNSRVYYSVWFGVVGGTGVDESNNIQLMLDYVGENGGGTVVICAANPSDPIHMEKTVSIYYSNVHVIFPPSQVITYEDKASLRIMGDYAQITREPSGFALRLASDATVVSGRTTLTLATGQGAYLVVGDKLIIRGQNDVGGKAIDKDTSFVKTIVGDVITLVDELDFAPKQYYPTSEWVPSPGVQDGTTIYVSEGSLFTGNVAINSTVVAVADGTKFAVGDMVEISDDRNEYAMNASAITGAGNPYLNPANLEQAQIIAISGNNITLDHALCRSYTTANYGGLLLMNPVVNSTISGSRISYTADGIRSANALQITYAMDCHIHDCYVNGLSGSVGRKGHGLRISYSYKCSAYRNHIVNAAYTGSGEGYGITIYYATLIMVDHNYISGCRHNILLQLATLAKVIANVSIDDRISGIDLHGVYSVRCSIQNNDVSRSSLNTSDSTKPGGIRIGNTSHTGGDHYNVIEGNTITGYSSTTADGIDIFAASTGNVIRNNTVIDCTTGLRFGLNSSQITPVQFIDNTLVEGNIFTRCTSRTIEIIAQPTYDNATSNGKFSQITFINNISDGNDRHFEITGVVTTLGVSDVIMVGNQVINPVNTTTTYYGVSVKYTSGFVHIYDNNVSKAQRGIYLQGNGVCHVIGNKTANTVQADPYTDGTGNTSVNYVDAMTVGSGTAFTSNTSITNTQPSFDFIESDAATNEKVWRLVGAAGEFYIQTLTDVFGGAVNLLRANRTGTTIDSLALAATAIGLTGATTATGTLSTTGNAGIGTATLTDRLNVATTGTGGAMITANTTGTSLFSGGHALNLFSSNHTGGLGFLHGANSLAVIQAFKAATEDGDLLLNPNGGRVGVNTTTLASSIPFTVRGTSRNQQSSDTRYRSDWLVTGGNANINAYDDVGTAYIPLLLDGLSVTLRSGVTTILVATSTGVAVTGNLSVSGTHTRSGTGFRYFYDKNAITFGVSAIDILPNDTGRARGVMIYGFATNSGGGVGEIRQMVSSGLPSDTTIGTDVLRITCTTGGKVSIVHYSHTGGSPQGTFSVSIDIYWAND